MRKIRLGLFKQHDAHPHEQSESMLVRATADFLLLLVVSLIILVVPPFSMEEAAKQQAALVMQRVLAPWHVCVAQKGAKIFYCPPSPSAVTAGQATVTVVRIDDAWFKQTNLAADGRSVWPPPVLNLAGIIQRIVGAKPRAVFIDIAFPIAPRELTRDRPVDRKTAVTALGKALVRLRPTMPVFIGDVIAGEDKECPDYIDVEGVGAARISDPDFVRVLQADPRAAANIHFVDISQGLDAEGAYQLAPMRIGQKKGCLVGQGPDPDDKPWLASPALALFKAYAEGCTRATCDERVIELGRAIDWRRNPGGLVSFRVNGDPAFADKLTGKLSMLWGSRLSPTLETILRRSPDSNDCVDQLGAPIADSLSIFRDNALNHGEATLDTRRCVYIDNISASDLWGANATDPPGAQPFDASSFLRGKLVIVGATVAQARDFVDSPVNGSVAGAYFHAVALENLVSFGRQFHGSGESRYAQFHHLSFWSFFLLSIGLAVMFRIVTWKICEHPFEPPFRRFSSFWRMTYLFAQYIVIPCCLFLGACVVGAVMFVLSDLPLTEMTGPMLLMALSVIEMAQEGIRESLRHALASPDTGKP